jgi:hypothetical protein
MRGYKPSKTKAQTIWKRRIQEKVRKSFFRLVAESTSKGSIEAPFCKFSPDRIFPWVSIQQNILILGRLYVAQILVPHS